MLTKGDAKQVHVGSIQHMSVWRPIVVHNSCSGGRFAWSGDHVTWLDGYINIT